MAATKESGVKVAGVPARKFFARPRGKARILRTQARFSGKAAGFLVLGITSSYGWFAPPSRIRKTQNRTTVGFYGISIDPPPGYSASIRGYQCVTKGSYGLAAIVQIDSLRRTVFSSPGHCSQGYHQMYSLLNDCYGTDSCQLCAWIVIDGFVP